LKQSFVFDQPTYRVIFGAGTFVRLREEVERLGGRHVLIVCTESEVELAQEAAIKLGDLAVGIFDDAVMHHPVETIQAARDCARDLAADCCVTIGGGTTTGTGKLIALESGIPVLAIPTTYAGSEMTPIYGMTEGSVKKTGRAIVVHEAVEMGGFGGEIVAPRPARFLDTGIPQGSDGHRAVTTVWAGAPARPVPATIVAGGMGKTRKIRRIFGGGCLVLRGCPRNIVDVGVPRGVQCLIHWRRA